MAKAIYKYLLKNDFTDDDDHITQEYHDAKRDEMLPALPEELQEYAEAVFQLIDTVYSDGQLPKPENNRTKETNSLNSNFDKKEFRELWSRINKRAAYAVDFDTNELVDKCITTLNDELRVTPLQYYIQRGEQTEENTYEQLQAGDAFQVKESSTGKLTTSIQSAVIYDLLGKISEQTQLTRKTIASILKDLNLAVFNQFKTNPEDFIAKASRLINEQKATVIVEHLTYDPLNEEHSLDIFTQEKPREDFSKAIRTERHIYDYVFTDSKNERNFVSELDTCSEVVVYSKLPRGFFIPTPVGDYNPDWAIAFKQGEVKHIYFIAETKGSMSSMDLREIEKSKIACAKKFFSTITSDQVKYDVVDCFSKLMEVVK
jgi:type III restriction enzyme